MKQDTITRALCSELGLRAYTAITTAAAGEIARIHGTTPNATVALGRTLTSAALLAATLKPGSEQSVAVRFTGSGPMKEVYAQADVSGNVRAYVSNPQVDLTDDLGAISFSRAIEAGFLTVIKNLGMKEPYRSVTPLVSGDIAGEIAHYLTVSEQIPSALILGLDLDREGGVASSGGILIQTFPDTPPEAIDLVESNIRGMDRSLADRLLEGADIVSVLSGIFGGRQISILQAMPLRHACACSRAYLLSVLGTIDPHDLRNMIEKDGGAEITCTFCRKSYRFDGAELRSVMPGS